MENRDGALSIFCKGQRQFPPRARVLYAFVLLFVGTTDIMLLRQVLEWCFPTIFDKSDFLREINGSEVNFFL